MGNLADFNFDANEHEPLGDFTPVPEGQYKVVAVESGWADCKNGQQMVFWFEIVEGEHRGRKLRVGLNLRNKGEKAVAIAKKELSSICRAVGVMTPADSSALHDKPILVTTKNRKDEDKIYTDIKKYEDLGATPAAPTESNGNAPWRK